MDKMITAYLENLKFGPVQQSSHFTVIPILTETESGPTYLTLGEALERGELVVSEVSENGSVPQLKVENRSKLAVFLLDGEELIGAKQNRVLNTSVLLKELSETTIPVSCTEQGRWSQTSPTFGDSDTVMPPRVRQHKIQSVSDSLRTRGDRRSDQIKVWSEINAMAEECKVSSPTGAMRDIYTSAEKLLSEFESTFQLVSGQTGLIVLDGGNVVGLDLVSRAAAFSKLFSKLIRSYGLSSIHEGEPTLPMDPIALAREFLVKACKSTESRHESIGYGHDFRFTSRSIVGSALVVDETVVHAAFFQKETPAKSNQTDRRSVLVDFTERRKSRS